MMWTRIATIALWLCLLLPTLFLLGYPLFVQVFYGTSLVPLDYLLTFLLIVLVFQVYCVILLDLPQFTFGTGQ
jgi:hypothetical protein